MSFIDFVIIIVYLGILLIIGIRLSKGNETQEDFFVAGRSMAWLPIALSVAATTISGNGLVGGPGWSYQSGLKAFMQNASIPLVLAFVCSSLLPFLYQLRITSCYEYLLKRFGSISQTLGAIGFLLSALIQVSSMVYIPALIISQLTGWNIKIVLIIIVLISTVYTLFGGLKAVIWTDVIQMLLVWGGIILIVFLALKHLNMSFGETMQAAKAAGKLKALDFSMDLNTENGVYVTLIGGGIMWLQYYIADQSQVQRLFSAKSFKEAKRSLLTSGILMNLIYFMLMIIGLLMYSVFNGTVFENTNEVMIRFIANQVPVGVLGCIIAAIFAAAMSSVDSLLNSMATVFIKDIYEPWIIKDEKTASLKVSRNFTLAMAIIVTLFSIFAFMNTTASVLAVVAGYISYLCGAILGMFLLGMLTKSCTDFGASCGFIAGVFGTVAAAKIYPINYLWYNVIGLGITMTIGYLASMARPENKPELIEQYTLSGYRKSSSLSEHMAKNGQRKSLLKIDKYTVGLLLFFAVQYVVLYILQ